MTDEFRELSNRLAKGMNFPKNSVCLITKLEDEECVNIRAKGNVIDIIKGICGAIDKILTESSEVDAFNCRLMLRDAIIADEERRFQKGETE